MKRLLLTTVFLLGTVPLLWAQHRVVERSFDLNQDQKIQLDFQFGEIITVKSWEQDKVSYKAVIEINNGKLNNALVLDFSQESDRLYISSEYDEQMLKVGRCKDCSEGEISFYSRKDDDRYVLCSNIQYKLKVPRYITLDVESISSDIELVGVMGAIQAHSVSGFIDLSWPSQEPADISIETISGEVFTDLNNLELLNRKDRIPIVGNKLKGRIGRGGTKISLESLSGNVYLRKQKI